MECKLTLNVFRFNSKTDYLPYYKKHVVKIDTKKSVANLLAIIKEDESSFDFPTGRNAAININGMALFVNEKISTIVENFGKELQLEPLNSKRATKDLSMNDDDFQASFDILDAYVDASDRKLYRSYVREHYSSPILNLEEDFIGDAICAFAYDMIEKYPDRKTDILNSISKKDGGIWLHVNISNKLFPKNNELEDKIIFLKNEILKQELPRDCFVQEQKKISENF